MRRPRAPCRRLPTGLPQLLQVARFPHPEQRWLWTPQQTVRRPGLEAHVQHLEHGLPCSQQAKEVAWTAIAQAMPEWTCRLQSSQPRHLSPAREICVSQAVCACGAAKPHHNDQVSAQGGRFGSLDANLLNNTVGCCMDAGGVKKRDRNAAHSHACFHNISGRPRLGGHDCAFAAAPRVQQTRLANIRTADDSDLHNNCEESACIDREQVCAPERRWKAGNHGEQPAGCLSPCAAARQLCASCVSGMVPFRTFGHRCK